MKPTLIGVVIDASGSMHEMAGVTVESYNEFLESQQKIKGHALLTRVIFNDEWPPKEKTYPVKDHLPLTFDDYQCGGMTALFDAVGYTIDRMLTRFDDYGNAILCIITDGHENSSKEYTRAQIRQKITDVEKQGFEVIYIGAGLDDMTDARAVITQVDGAGAMGGAMSTDKSRVGTRSGYRAASRAVSSKRRRGRVAADWNAPENDTTGGDNSD